MAQEVKELIKKMTINTPLEREGFNCCKIVDVIAEQHIEDVVKQSALYMDVMIHISTELMNYKNMSRSLHYVRQMSVQRNTSLPKILY